MEPQFFLEVCAEREKNMATTCLETRNEALEALNKRREANSDKKWLPGKNCYSCRSDIKASSGNKGVRTNHCPECLRLGTLI